MLPYVAVESSTHMIQQFLSAIHFISQGQELSLRAPANLTV
jgi:hypothetical protein